MGRLRVAALLNWGIGQAVLEAIDQIDGLEVVFIGTNFEEDSNDPWRNAVYDHAQTSGYHVVHDTSLTFEDLRTLLIRRGVDLMLVHAFMRIIPRSVISVPRLGTVNLHASLLPRHRGPSPAHWVLKEKDRETGLTTHYMVDEPDAGDIIAQARIPVFPDDTVSSIIERLKPCVLPLIRETIAKVQDRQFVPIPQNIEEVTYAPRPTR